MDLFVSCVFFSAVVKYVAPIIFLAHISQLGTA